VGPEKNEGGENLLGSSRKVRKTLRGYQSLRTQNSRILSETYVDQHMKKKRALKKKKGSANRIYAWDHINQTMLHRNEEGRGSCF